MEFKKCFNTKKKLPLFMFQKDNSKYQLKADKGTCKVCRYCNIKKSLLAGGIFARFDEKYEFKPMKWYQIIIYFLK
jgi:hypothetical protein